MEISWEFGGAENKDIVIPTSPDFISPFLPSQLHCQNFDHQHWLTVPRISFSSSPCITFVTQLNFHPLTSFFWIWPGWIGQVSTYLLGLQSYWFSHSLGQIFLQNSTAFVMGISFSGTQEPYVFGCFFPVYQMPSRENILLSIEINVSREPGGNHICRNFYW